LATPQRFGDAGAQWERCVQRDQTAEGLKSARRTRRSHEALATTQRFGDAGAQWERCVQRDQTAEGSKSSRRTRRSHGALATTQGFGDAGAQWERCVQRDQTAASQKRSRRTRRSHRLPKRPAVFQRSGGRVGALHAVRPSRRKHEMRAPHAAFRRLPAAMVAGPGTGTRPCTLTLPATPPFQQGAQEQNRAEKADTDQKPVQ